MNKAILRKYARLIAQCGVNVQKGQEVLIQAELDQPEFVEMVAEACYKLGAKKVVVDWSHQPMTKLHVRWRSLESLSTMEEYEEARWRHNAEELPCRIILESSDPDGLKGIDQAKWAASQQKIYPVIRPYRDQMENRHQWCIAAVPGVKWAKKLFPEYARGQAVDALWKAILKTCRIEGDPVKAWDEHNRNLEKRCSVLNALGIEKLHYYAKNGTNLTVGMIPEGRFLGGADTTLQGVKYNPNIPSEECFVSPMKGQAEGVVYASMPLSYKGEMIENFRIRFENGRAVEWHAEKGEELLSEMIGMDEGSAYLGECALVPCDSPICQSGIMFFNTLFDENAACHLALGMGFADTIEGYQEKTLEQCRAMGVNDSMIHVDFMIGTPDLNIDALTRDGRCVPVFRKGTWAF